MKQRTATSVPTHPKNIASVPHLSDSALGSDFAASPVADFAEPRQLAVELVASYVACTNPSAFSVAESALLLALVLERELAPGLELAFA